MGGDTINEKKFSLLCLRNGLARIDFQLNGKLCKMSFYSICSYFYVNPYQFCFYVKMHRYARASSAYASHFLPGVVDAPIFFFRLKLKGIQIRDLYLTK